jgi:hypothetical protein
MAELSTVKDDAPTKHAVSVTWFRRDPGGSTMFVIPATTDRAGAQPITEHSDCGVTQD